MKEDIVKLIEDVLDIKFIIDNAENSKLASNLKERIKANIM